MADWKNRKAPKTKKSRAKDRWVPGGQRLTGKAEAPKPKPAESKKKKKKKKISLDELLALRNIPAPLKADLEAIAAEFHIDISGDSNNDERAETLAEYTYEV